MSRIFGSVCQNGYVVHDIRKAMEHWIEDLGVGPWFYIERGRPNSYRHRGVDSPIEVSIALANSGNLQIELIQQLNDAPSMYKEFLDAGHEGLHHLSYWTEDYDALYQRALSLGYTVGDEGAGPRGRFAYFDTESHPGTVIEISDISSGKAEHFANIRQAAIEWDGSNPIRDLRGTK